MEDLQTTFNEDENMNEIEGDDVYVSLTGDQCALTNIKIN